MSAGLQYTDVHLGGVTAEQSGWGRLLEAVENQSPPNQSRE